MLDLRTSIKSAMNATSQTFRALTTHATSRAAGIRWALLVLALLLVVPAGLMAVGAGFDGVYGQDAFAYFEYAAGPLFDSLLAVEPPPRFHWPPGYPLLVALTMLMVGTVPEAGQLVSLLAGGAVAVFTALLAYEVWTPARVPHRLFVAALAGILVATTGQLWQSSIVVMADTTALAAATLGMLALARYKRRPRTRWLVLAAGGLAWAILTRWAYVLVALPAAGYALVVLKQRPRSRARRDALLAIGVAGLILAPLLVTVVRDLLAPSGEYLSFAAAGQIYRWHPVTALRSTHVTADGVLQYRLPNGLYYALTPARSFYFTPLIAFFILPGLWVVLRRRRVVPLAFLVAWPASVYLFHAGTAWQNVRFTLAYLPPLAILAAIGVVALAYSVRGRRRQVLVVWLVAGLIAMVIGGVRLTDEFIARMQADVATVRWAEAQLPPDAQVLTFGLTLTFRHESTLDTYELYVMEPAELARLANDDRPAYLLLDVANAQTQWQGRAPEVNYRWLREHPGLREVGTHRQYTLFRIGPATDAS